MVPTSIGIQPAESYFHCQTLSPLFVTLCQQTEAIFFTVYHLHLNDPDLTVPHRRGPGLVILTSSSISYLEYRGPCCKPARDFLGS